MTIRGRVYEQSSGRGLPGVCVSNGEAIVATDADGQYLLPVEPPTHRFVFLTVPDGFRAEADFFCSTLGWQEAPGAVNFPLLPAAPGTGAFVHVTDFHVVTEGDRLTRGAVLAEDLRQVIREAAPDFILASGDLTNRGTLAELHEYRAAVRSLSTPVYSLFGGHDGVEERSQGEAGSGFTRHYEEVLGPTYYSFDAGDRHFVLYPDEEGFFTPADRERKQRWLWADLALQPAGREIVVVIHQPPRRAFLDGLSRFNVRLLLHGHWHSSKLFSYGRIVVSAAPPLGFGGIDTAPRGYRRITAGDDGLRLAFTPLSLYGESSEPSRDSPTGSMRERLGQSEHPLRLLWERRLPVGLHRTAPVICGDRILVSLCDEEHGTAGAPRCGVACCDAASGEYRWQATSDASIKNSAAVRTGREHGRSLAVAVSVTGRVHALDRATGERLWHADLPGYPERWVYTSPAIDECAVYAGAKSGYGAYDPLTGQPRWYTPIESSDAWSCYASPLLCEDLLITLIPRRGLVALNRHDGAIAWERPVPVEYYYAAPILAGEWLISGGDADSLLVLQARTGEIVRHEPVLDARYPTGLAAESSRIYATTSEGEAHCYDLHSGRRLWRFRSGDDLLDMTPYRRATRSLLAAPLPLGERVLIGGCDGRLTLLDGATGEIRASVALGSPITAAACVTEASFCVGTYDGGLYRFALP